MNEVSPKFIQNPVRLSDSKIWEIQRSYFETMGISAWKEEVPFYISSNALIGQRYANLVFQFMQDYAEQYPDDLSSSFYIVELGSGTGKFSYYFLRALAQLLSLNHSNFRFCYIITDITQKNLDFCEKNPGLIPFLQNQQLDFASFNIETDTDFFLLKEQKYFSELKTTTPLIIVGNYVFDCVQQDAFEYDAGIFKEIKLGLSSRYPNFKIEGAKHLDDLKLQFESSEIKPEHYYEENALKVILKDYAAEFKDKKVTVMMPLGAFQFLENMHALTHGHFFMISGDKGIALSEKMPLLKNENLITYDGCYSFYVNFHAMGSYLKQMGGDYYPTQHSNHFKVNLFSGALSFSSLPRTRLAFSRLEAVGPDEYCYIFDEFLTSSYRFSFKGLLSFLRLSEWDPIAYSVIHDRILELLPSVDKQIASDLPDDLRRVEENIYPINFGPDVHLQLGIYYQSLNEQDTALKHYEKSLEIFGNTAATHNNMAIIYENKKNFAKALEHYQESVKLDKKNIFAKRKVLRLTGKPHLAMLTPVLKGIFVVAALSALVFLLFR